MLRTTMTITIAMLGLAGGCGPLSSLGDLPTGTDTGADGTQGTGPGDGGDGGDGTTGTGDDGGSTGTTTTDTSTTNPACGAIPLADIAQGIGGFALDGEAPGDHSGDSVGGAGDVNGDGLAEVVVGAPGADANGVDGSGRTYVVFGKADTDRVPLADLAQGVGGFVLDGGTADRSGDSVAGAGDINADGLADLIVGAPYLPPGSPSFGRTYVVLGKAVASNVWLADVTQGIGGFVVENEAEDDFGGYSVSGAGDVNGDGFADVIVGAADAGPNGLVASGRTYVVFGKADTDNVSLADVALGLGGFALDGEAGWDHSGVSVSGAGDVNGDGLDDVVVGASNADANDGTDSGRVYVVFGKTDTDKISLADVASGLGGFALDGEAEEDWAGLSVSEAGDVNGDGLADVVVGAPNADPNGIDLSGRSYVVFGRADTEAIPLGDIAAGIGGFAADGEAAGDQSGRPVSGAGDVNGDGLADVLVAAGLADPNGLDRSGRTYVVFGKTTTDSVLLSDVARGVGGFALDGQNARDEAGSAVSGAGDVNGDGLADVLVGGSQVDPSGVDRAGRTYVVFGRDCAGKGAPRNQREGLAR